MSWNRNEAEERIRKAYEETRGLELKPLSRETDLHNLALNDCRIVTGVHLYLDSVNFIAQLEEAREDEAKLKKLLRHAHVYQRLLSRLLADVDGGLRVHFQGLRLHAVFYKPYDSSDYVRPNVRRLAAAAQFVAQARELVDLLAEETGFEFELEAAMECGDTIATVNGQVGCRELLFIGSAANLPAKSLEGDPGDRYCENAEKLRDLLPEPQPLPERWKTAVKEDVEANPVSRFELFEPEVAIDYDSLGCRTADLKEGVSFFADISGFTAHVAGLSSNEEKVVALRFFHAARSEMHQVAVRDYQGDFIQYQGDRIQSLYYQAKTSGRFASKAIEAAAAIKEAFDLCLRTLPGHQDLGMTVGAACGRVFVTQVGIKGDREVLVLGRSVAQAAHLQDDAQRGEIAINAKLWELLTEDEQSHFTARDDAYVGTLSLAKLLAEEESKVYEGRIRLEGNPVFGRRISAVESGGVRPAKSYLGNPRQ